MKLSTFVAAVTFAAAPRAAAFTGKVGFAGSSSLLRSASSSFAARRVVAAVPASSGSFRMLFGGLNPLKKKGVDYEALKDTAKEAATAALAGRVLTKSDAGYDVATFAGGCFWGLELAFQRVPGVTGTAVGYTHGKTDKPAYEEVCSGRTGHTEAVLVFYDAKEVHYKQLLDVFFGRIDPTQRELITCEINTALESRDAIELRSECITTLAILTKWTDRAVIGGHNIAQ
eukprot:15576-Heterococcus_DN1.PRE.1